MGHVIYHFARTGGIETNPTTFSQRAATFASAIANSGHATLLTRREATGLNGYLILPTDSEQNQAARLLAHTVGARAEVAEMPTDLGDTPAHRRAALRPRTSHPRNAVRHRSHRTSTSARAHTA